VGAARGRVVEAALFTTFAFQPGFFEQEVLSTLFDGPFSTAPKVKLVQLEEALRRGAHIAVFYDPQALETTGLAPVLDVERVAMARATGCFHPKVALVLVRDGDVRSLVLLVTSANLSRSGWWDNVEVSHICEIEADTESHYREPLQHLLGTLRDQTRARGEASAALQAIDRFLESEVATPRRRSRKAPLHPRMFVGEETLPRFIRDALGSSRRDLHLEVVSPYFDRTEAGALRALIDTLEPLSTTVYLPRDDDGRAECRAELYESVLAMGAQWGSLQGQLRKRGGRASERSTERFVHAKVYRLWSRRPQREVVVLGSANLTRAGHAAGAAGNVEASVLLENPQPRKLRPWLEVDETRPLEFSEDPPQEDERYADLPVLPIDIAFSWETEEARLHWAGAAREEPIVLKMLDQPLGPPLSSLVPGWNSLPADISTELKSQLSRTAFVTPFIGGEEHHLILVSEEGMAHKPSLLFDLTPEDILRYWSLLSEEQRNAFIEEEGHQELVIAGLAAARLRSESEDRSFFTRFAGIFHAFERLEADVRSALEDGRWKSAEYQLFGKKYHSLAHLLDKLSEGEGGWDAVERYVAVLTARDLVRRLRRLAPDFWQEHSRSAAALEARLSETAELIERLDLGDSESAEDFIEWFEEAFAEEPR
jgi:hypothetical protein